MRVAGQVYMHCNRKIIVCRLPDAARQRYDRFKYLSRWAATYKIPGSEWTDDSVASKNSVDNMTIES